MAVARAGENDVPARAAPVALRPFLHFAKLPAHALVAARRALDADEAFRARVAERVSEEEVGPAGWLMLTRPPGWEADLEALARRAEDEHARVAEQRAEDGARRRLGVAEAAARRAEEAATAARDELARAAAALADERRARRTATTEAAELAGRIDSLATERDHARAEAAAARSEAAAARAQAAAARSEAAAARADRDRARAEVAAVTEAAAGSTVEPASAKVDADLVREPAPRLRSIEPHGADASGTGQEGADALRSAAHAARALADALAATARAMSGTPDPPPGVAPSTAAVEGGARLPPRPPPVPARRSRSPRTPAKLPPAIFEESHEAAEHLSRLPGVVILVDGYNVSHAGWPGAPIAEQRRRLVDALAELVARTGADVRVVFDGAETTEPQAVATTARPVRVRFSPPGVEADDVIVAEVGEIPAPRPVVVASSDRRVRLESETRGANLLRSSQLLALLRR